MNRSSRLHTMDLNLLPVFRELMRTRSVTRAAEALNMSQSATSEALKRLRSQFKDDLLVWSGREMRPTRAAIALAPAVEQALADVEALLSPQPFNIAEAQRQFVIATADSVSLPLGPGIIHALTEHAPGITVQFIDLQWVERRMLESGDVDFIIMPLNTLQQGRRVQTIETAHLGRMLLFEEEFVCIARKGHPALGAVLDRDTLRDLPTVAYRADPRSPLFGGIPGQERAARMLAPQFSLLPFLVAGSDAVAMLPKHLAEHFAAYLDVVIAPWNLQVPTTQICAFWAQVQENDPVHRWFRQLLGEVAANGAF